MIMRKVVDSFRAKKHVGPEDLWTVFLVEDDMDDQIMAQRVLKNSPYVGEVICVSESARVFDYIARHKRAAAYYDPQKTLILLDIHMPGLNGLALLELLRSSPDTRDLPIIIITGDREPDKVFQSYRRNASSFISKPITSAHLANIHTVLEYSYDWHAWDRVS